VKVHPALWRRQRLLPAVDKCFARRVAMQLCGASVFRCCQMTTAYSSSVGRFTDDVLLVCAAANAAAGSFSHGQLPSYSPAYAPHLVRLSAAATPAAGCPVGQQALVLVVCRELRRRVREDAQQLRYVALPEGQ